MKPLRILLVDDSVTFLDSATEFLGRDPRLAIVGRATDGRRGIHLVQELRPDLVLLDASMPYVDGFRATRTIKSLPAPPKVIIVTLHDIPSYRRAAVEAGADGYVPKTEFTREVLAAIERLLSPEAGAPTEPAP